MAFFSVSTVDSEREQDHHHQQFFLKPQDNAAFGEILESGSVLLSHF